MLYIVNTNDYYAIVIFLLIIIITLNNLQIDVYWQQFMTPNYGHVIHHNW